VKRRSVLLAGAGVAAGALGGALLWRPGDHGANHNAYFSALNELLKRDGPGRPVMVIDRERMNHNIDWLAASVGPDKTYRVVVKSLPCVALLGHVMERARTRALMAFHQPFLNAIATAYPDADVLLGKPLPVAAARQFYVKLGSTAFDPARQLQWLIDTPTRLAQYQALARELGVAMRINLEIDVGLHRGGIEAFEALDPLFATIAADRRHLGFAGFMGYEPHLSGVVGGLGAPTVQAVLARYHEFIGRARGHGYDPDTLTLNGAGSHTLAIYHDDATMNDLSAGSAVVKPYDFDTPYLADNVPAAFIATPILKRYDALRAPGDPSLADVWQWWDPNRQRLYFIYGGYWKARFVSPPGVPDPIYHSTNQEPVSTSRSVDLAVDDYMFLRPTQSERVMLEFGDLLIVDDGKIVDRWPVFHETG
jgi:D-serine deaminase-like pyridoxal phosphate-dependent protein